MFKVFSNFIPDSQIVQAIEKSKILPSKDITLFNDYPNIDNNNLNLNPINICMAMEPNQLFSIHDWVVQNGGYFNIIIAWGEDILNAHQTAILFPFGISWLDQEYVESVDSREKKFEVSFLCGAKKMIEGHKLRHRLYSREDEIIIPKFWNYTLPDYDFNNGHHTVTDMYGKKVLWNSMYSICIENSSNKNYHTEKIIDAFLSKTVPVYWGCPNLEELGYDPRGFIYCKDENEIIQAVNSLSESDYESRREAIEYNYEVAKHYGDFFGRLTSLLEEIVTINGL